MQQILVYGDSLAWGIVPDTRRRHPFPVRWPGRLERGLLARGLQVRVVENCLNGRRTVWEDPFKPGRNGLMGLAQAVEMHSPLALVILALGVNDFQSMHPHDPWHSSQGLGRLVGEVRGAPLEPGMPVPPVLVVAPPPMDEPRGAIAPKFRGAEVRSAGLAQAYRTLAVELDCAFFDAGSVARASRVDGVHLDAGDHQCLGDALVEPVAGLLGGDGGRG